LRGKSESICNLPICRPPKINEARRRESTGLRNSGCRYVPLDRKKTQIVAVKEASPEVRLFTPSG
jgi:hypothetical protein